MLISAVLIVGSLLLAFLVLSGSIRGGLPVQYRDRACQGRAWLRTFPSTSKAEIREFLTLFSDAFDFSEQDRLRFGPDDKIMDVYRALYPTSWGMDELELEELARDMQRRYCLDLYRRWREDLTLGELFAATRITR